MSSNQDNINSNIENNSQFEQEKISFKSIINTFKTNGRVQCILAMVILLTIINILLFYYDQFTLSSSNTSSSILNGVYFTSTQFSTVGYGDICPKTTLAKVLASTFQFIIVFISLNIATEFGVASALQKNIENDIKRNVRMGRRRTEISEELAENVAKAIIQKKQITSFESTVNQNEKVNNVSRLINRISKDKIANVRDSLAQNSNPFIPNLERIPSTGKSSTENSFTENINMSPEFTPGKNNKILPLIKKE